MIRHVATALVLLSSTAMAQPVQVTEIPFTSELHPLKLPANLYFGEVSGIALNSQGHVFAFSRGNTDLTP